METEETKRYPDVRLPIVTIKANPYEATRFPVIISTALSLTKRQSLGDGAVRTQEILDSLSAYFPKNTRDSKENRAYLRQEVEAAKTVIDITRRRYASGQVSVGPLPIFFQDFDRRFDRIILELGGVPSFTSALENITAPRLVLAQMPKTSDSVTAKKEPGNLDKALGDFVAVLIDVVKGFVGMSQSGTTGFSWSIITTPPGAEIWISRLRERETKWAGVTNIVGQTLENAIWTFRVDWNGCSRYETPNPYLQAPIEMQLTKIGCVKP